MQQQLFAVMTAVVQISPEILLNQMRESCVCYHRCDWQWQVLGQLERRCDEGAGGKALDNVTPDKVTWQTSAYKRRRESPAHINSDCRSPPAKTEGRKDEGNLPSKPPLAPLFTVWHFTQLMKKKSIDEMEILVIKGKVTYSPCLSCLICNLCRTSCRVWRIK